MTSVSTRFRGACMQAMACGAAMLIANSAIGGLIGINITTNRSDATPGGSATADSNLDPSDVAGLVPQSGWNNKYALFAGDGNTHAFDPDGALVGTGGETATITNNGPTGNWRTQDHNSVGGSPTERLFDGYLEAFVDNGTDVSLTVDGLDEGVFASGYSVIVYFGSEGGVRAGRVQLNGGPDIPVDVIATYGSYDTDDTDGVGTLGDGINAYEFTNVTGSSFTVNVRGDDTPNRFGVAGLQIVPNVPEPTSVVMAAVGCLALGAIRRRMAA